MAKKKKKSEPKSGEMDLGNEPGVARVSIPEIDAAAAEYVRVRDRRMDLTKKEVEAKDELTRLMHANEAAIGRAPDGAMRYVYDDLEVSLFPVGEQLKVKKYVDPGAPE